MQTNKTVLKKNLKSEIFSPSWVKPEKINVRPVAVAVAIEVLVFLPFSLPLGLWW